MTGLAFRQALSFCKLVILSKRRTSAVCRHHFGRIVRLRAQSTGPSLCSGRQAGQM